MSAEKIKSKQITKPRKQRGTVDTSKALSLRLENNLSYQQIADIQGVSKQAIHAALKELLPTEETNVYKNQRADILANLQTKIIKSIDDADIKKAPFGSRILAMAQLIDKERLERGQSTENIAQIHGDIAKIKAAMQNKSDSGQGD
jgi:predicted DNA-binding protein YlxM (UPF0122 family)